MTHPWPMFPPEANWYSLALGPRSAPSVAAAATLEAHHAAMTGVAGTSMAQGAVTAEAYTGVSGTVSEAALVSHNNEHLVFAEQALVKAQIFHTAGAVNESSFAQMVPAPPAHANRFEEAADEVINPMVLGALTPRIADLNVEYFGFMWPNNAAAGVRYGAALDGLGAALMMPSLPAISGGSVAAGVAAAASLAEGAALSGMQAAVGLVGSGVSAVAGPAAAAPAAAMSAVSSSGSSVSTPASTAPVQPLAAVTQTAPPTPAQTMAPSQASAGMFAPSPNANLMTPPPVPPTAQPPVQPMLPRPPTPAMPAAPGITSFTPPAEPFSPPPPPTAGRATGLAPGMLNASALRGPVSAMPLVTSAASSGLATATQPLAYVPPDVPRPIPPMPPQQPPLQSGDATPAQHLQPATPPQQTPPQQTPPQHTPPQYPQPQPQQPGQPSYQQGGSNGSGIGPNPGFGPGSGLQGAGQAPGVSQAASSHGAIAAQPQSPAIGSRFSQENPTITPDPPKCPDPTEMLKDWSDLVADIDKHNENPPDPTDLAAVAEYDADAIRLNSKLLDLSSKLLDCGIPTTINEAPKQSR